MTVAICAAALATAQFNDSRNNQYSIYFVGDFLNDNGKSVMTDMNDPKTSEDDLWFTGHAEVSAGLWQPIVWRQTINGPSIDQLPLGVGFSQGKSFAIESLIALGSGSADAYHAVGSRKSIGNVWQATRWRRSTGGALTAASLHESGWSESWATGLAYDSVSQESLTVGEYVASGTRRAVVWGGVSGRTTLPLPPGCSESVARQVRNRLVVGSCFESGSALWRAAVWTKTGDTWTVELVAMGGFTNVGNSFGMGINDFGDVVGTVMANGIRRGFYRLAQSTDALPAPDLSNGELNDNSALYGINNARWMVGESRDDFTGQFVPMLIYWNGGPVARSVSSSPLNDGYGGSMVFGSPDVFNVDDPASETKVGYGIGERPFQLAPLAITGIRDGKEQALMVRASLSTDGQDGMGIGKVLIGNGVVNAGDTITGQGAQDGRNNAGDEGPMGMNEDKLCSVRFELQEYAPEPDTEVAVWMFKDSNQTEVAQYVVPLHWAGGTILVTTQIPGFFTPNNEVKTVSVLPLLPVITVDSISGKQVGDNVTLKAKIAYPGLDQKYIGKVKLKFQIYLSGAPKLDLGEIETNAATGEATTNLTIPSSVGVGSREIRVTFAGRFDQPDASQYWPWLKAATGTAPMTLQSNTVITVPTIPAAPGATVELNAQLAYQGAPTSGIAGQTLSFTVNGQGIGSAVTDFAGVARITYQVPTTQQTDMAIGVGFDSQIADLFDTSGSGIIDVNLSEFLWQLRQSLVSNAGISYQSTNNTWGGQYVLEGSFGEPIVFAVGGDATYNAEWIIRAGFWQAALAIPWLPDFTGIGR